MNFLVITFDEIKEHLYKVSIQKSKTSRGQKRARTENEPLVRVFVFQWMTPPAPTVKVSPALTKPSKKVMSRGP